MSPIYRFNWTMIRRRVHRRFYERLRRLPPAVAFKELYGWANPSAPVPPSTINHQLSTP